MRLKRRLLEAQSKASSLAKTIKHDPDWDWANNAGNLGRLVARMDELDNKIKEEGLTSILHDEPKTLKGLGEDHLLKQLSRFMRMQEDVDELAAAYAKLVKRHHVLR